MYGAAENVANGSQNIAVVLVIHYILYLDTTVRFT